MRQNLTYKEGPRTERVDEEEKGFGNDSRVKNITSVTVERGPRFYGFIHFIRC